MASLRDRFFSRKVSRALTSPSGILAAGAGAAVGVVLTAPVSVPLAVAGGLIGALVGLGGRVAVALPGGEPKERIDPFAVGEPWRHAVKDAQQARNRFADAVKSFRPGPLKDSMATVGEQMDAAVRECWEVAKQGQLVAGARKRIDDREVRWEMERAQTAIGSAPPTQTQQNTLDALQSQMASAQRMDVLIADTKSQLDLLNARLDESVTRAIELSVSNRMSDATLLGTDVGAIVDDLEALRRAIQEVDQPGAGGATGMTQPAGG